MTGLLAIETSTDACSVALYRNGEIQERCEIAPRRHNQVLFAMLQEILPSGRLSEHGIEAVAYGCGPGSFTGLRIATSAVQGLAFANDLPAVAVSTLACLVQRAFREQKAEEGDHVLALIDAKINEIYWAHFEIRGGIAIATAGPGACSPDALPVAPTDLSCAVGDGCKLLPQSHPAASGAVYAELTPRAQDLVPLALEKFTRGEVQQADQVVPLYVREEISWKKLPQQGRQS